MVKSKAADYNAALRYVKYTTIASNSAVLKSTKSTKAAEYNAASRYIKYTTVASNPAVLKSKG
jgi:hypothetical protein